MLRFGDIRVILAAAIAMAATLPGRTHGLGLITTRLLDDFPQLNESRYAQINLVATLLGSLFCLPAGWLIDRYGPRGILLVTTLALSACVAGMTHAAELVWLAVLITLTRGLGQSMLSVVSIAMLGKWFRGTAGGAMGAYSVLMTVFMATATGLLASSVADAGWRGAWNHQALVLGVAAILAFIVAPPFHATPASAAQTSATLPISSATLAAALSSGCFWIFAVSISLFGMAVSGVSLFQQSILQECGLPETVYHQVLVIGLLAGMAANLLGGWAARRIALSTLLALALFLLSGSMAALPLLRSAGQAYAQAIVSGAAGGLLTVLFFAIWGHAFGPRELARIQSVAQMMTVLASAVGPLLVAQGHAQWGSYLPALAVFAGAFAILGMTALVVPVPSAERGDWAVPAADVPTLAQECS